MRASIEQRAAQWIVGRDTGISSKTMWSVMMGVESDWSDAPYDAGDFGRCYRLLKLIPEWRGRLQEVADKYPEWVALVREWKRLEVMYRKVIASGLTSDDSRAMHEAMRPLIDEGRSKVVRKRRIRK